MLYFNVMLPGTLLEKKADMSGGGGTLYKVILKMDEKRRWGIINSDYTDIENFSFRSQNRFPAGLQVSSVKLVKHDY